MSGQTQHSAKVEARRPTSCAPDISSDAGVERGLCAESLKTGLAADKTGNNANRNNHTSSTARAVKNSLI